MGWFCVRMHTGVPQSPNPRLYTYQRLQNAEEKNSKWSVPEITHFTEKGRNLTNGKEKKINNNNKKRNQANHSPKPTWKDGHI